ncbi:MAG TPA: response regulator [Acidobacteriaceae bacterium]|jgi:signal transduction histidine kinase/CheY-like chemotaxis protein|nr:response regulator [Acidobacteriaceae bacterium]
MSMFMFDLCVVLAIALSIALVKLTRARRRNTRLTAELARAMRESSLHQTALQQRKQLDDLKDEFISTVSHELRTPLTSIRGALGLLSSGVLGKVDDKAANLLRIASTNTDRLVRLINDILDLERMESGRAPLQIRRCSLRELVSQSIETMSSMAHNAAVTLEAIPEPAGTSITFDGDPDRIQQVLTNLLSNAIKFSPVGSSVRVLTGSDGSNLILQVEDSGRGVPPDKLETIFDRFGQVESNDARQKGGTGLGLAICRSIVTQHGGTIWAERNEASGKGRPGTTVIMRLPRHLASEQTSAAPEPPECAILVVDDDAIVRQIVGEHLRRNGYQVIETASGEAALHVAERQPVEAILLDLYMPGMSGWETIERLKKNPLTAQIPVVILSVLSPSSKSPEIPHLVATAQGWVQKPFNESLLLAELGRVLHPGSGPGRILLVEDDEDLATVVLSSFQNAETPLGMSIEHAASMAEAEEVCRKDPPDLLILDLTLPDGSGFALVDWLRRQPRLRTLPLVVYSGREVSESEMSRLRLGPTQFLTKARVEPRDVEDLVLAMVRHLHTPTPVTASA